MQSAGGGGGANRSGAIRTQIARLELLDPALGGEPYTGRVRAVKAKVGE